MAVKISRQMSRIALLGVPSSAASPSAGHERGPSGWRAQGLTDRLREAGFQVTDYGDCTERISAPDEAHPRTRNVEQALATLEELRPKIEIAVKSAALPMVLGGDDSIVLATIAGCRRYYRAVGLVYFDRDGGLNVPATTPSGCVDGMVISHVIGRGAPELVRFWGEPPLVREHEVALLGIDRLDAPEQEYLASSRLHRYPLSEINREGATATTKEALERVHGLQNEFVLHIDLDVIASEDFPATNLAAPGGLRWQELEEALGVLVPQPKLAALVISAYNPALDPDGGAARRFIELLVRVLGGRITPAAAAPETPATPEAPTPEGGPSIDPTNTAAAN